MVDFMYLPERITGIFIWTTLTNGEHKQMHTENKSVLISSHQC